MTRRNYKIGIKYEDIGKEYLGSLGFRENKPSSKYSSFDFVTKDCVFEIKTKRLPCSRKYTFDFTKRQIDSFRKSEKKIKILLILVKGNKHEFRIIDMNDFQNMDRVFDYEVFNWLRRARLTLKREKRVY